MWRYHVPVSNWWLRLIDSHSFFIIYVFEVEESYSDVHSELPFLGNLKNPGKLPVQHVLEDTGECVL